MRQPVPLSTQLRQAIEASELTRYRISKLTGLSESQLSRFVRGERGLSLDAVDRLGALLGLRLVVTRSGARKVKVIQ